MDVGRLSVGVRVSVAKEVVMTKMIQRHKCKCTTCGQSHTVETVVDVESLPIGIECLIVPNDDADKTWTLTIIDHTKQGVESSMELSDMKA